jgi:hypothetical protein
MAEGLFGYVVFATGLLVLGALYTAALAWWLRWIGRRLGFWDPGEDGDSDKEAGVASVK